MNVDWTKPILWDDHPARVLTKDFKGLLPVLIAIFEGGREHLAYCDHLGRDSMGRQRVTNAPERVERWANVYAGDVCGSHGSRKAADANAESGRTALVRYVFEGDKLVSAEVVPLEGK